MKRRSFMVLSASVLGGCVAGPKLPKQAVKAMPNLPPIVLVHGAWHGGWCWKFVAKQLRDNGLAAYTPTLTGLGERSHLRTPVPTLETHIEDVIRVIEWNELEDVVLVGHSYAGMVITGVADRLRSRLSHVMYLDAALPANGESMLTQSPSITAATVADVEQELRSMTPDGTWIPPFPATALGIPEDRADLIDWVNRHMTPHPLRTWTDALDLAYGGSEGLPRSYILCTNPVLARSSFPAHAARIRDGLAGDGWRSRELATGHDAMVIEPDAVTREILSLLT